MPQDINAALHVENSVFPRNRKKDGNFEKLKGNKSGSMGTSSRTMSNANHLIAPKIVTEQIDEDGFLDSDDEGAAILGRSQDFTEGALTTRSGISDVSKLSQETNVQDGVHVTCL